MANREFESAISTLQTSKDYKVIHNALISIRKELDWPKNKHNVARLRERGGLKQVTGILLSCHHKTCISLALSILGNCLMDRACTSEVVSQHNILSLLNQLLKRYPKEDSINGRTFRIIGNMCQHRDQWATIIIDKKPLIITQVVEVIQRASKDESIEENKISEATIITALRTLRELLNSRTVITLVNKFGALKAIGALFIKYSTEWQANQQNEKMVLDTIRVIQEYSKFRYYHSILEMRNTERGDSLVHLTNVLLLAPRRIVKIVMNFIRSSQLQSELPVKEICKKFVEVLENHSVVKEFGDCYTEYLQCLCFLFDHPANRNEERCGMAIPLLIKVLKELEEPSNKVVECCVQLIMTLNKFKYSKTLLQEQLKHGIIPVLVDKLTWLVGPPSVLSVKHTNERKRKYEMKEDFFLYHRVALRDTISVNSPTPSEDEYDIFHRLRPSNRSPSPCSSSDGDSVNALSWSEPNSTPDRSLVNESDSDNYSPVCSEADDTEFPAFLDQPDKDRDFSDPLLPPPMLQNSMDGGSEVTIPETSKGLVVPVKLGLIHSTIRLLKAYMKLRPPPPHLVNVDLLRQLTKCALTDQFAVRDTICNIVECHEHLIPLMQTDFIFTLWEVGFMSTRHDSCARCLLHTYFANLVLGKITQNAESGAGKGDIAHILMRGNKDVQEKLVMSIPYIIMNRSILGKLMLNCGGLNILMRMLAEENEQNNRGCLKVLCQMASNGLSISNPKKPQEESDQTKPKIVPGKYKLPEDCSNVVSFIFDDGNVLRADRDFLIEKSEFFNGLLNGHFKERGQSEISLAKVDSRSFECMLSLLMGVQKTEIAEVDLEIENLLDVVMLCDRFLLIDLCVFLTDSMEQYNLSTQTVPTIYNWSVESGTNLLRVESVAYALVATVSENERFAMFENLFSLGYREQLIEDIQNLLIRYLTLSDFDQRLKDLTPRRRTMMDKMRDRLLKANA